MQAEIRRTSLRRSASSTFSSRCVMQRPLRRRPIATRNWRSRQRRVEQVPPYSGLKEGNPQSRGITNFHQRSNRPGHIAGSGLPLPEACSVMAGREGAQKPPVRLGPKNVERIMAITQPDKAPAETTSPSTRPTAIANIVGMTNSTANSFRVIAQLALTYPYGASNPPLRESRKRAAPQRGWFSTQITR